MPEILRFEELVPETDYFELIGGEKISFRSALEMNATDSARYASFENRFVEIRKKVEADPSDEDAAGEFDNLVDDFVRFVLPEIPEEALSRMYLGQKNKILEWWTERQNIRTQKEEPEGEEED